MEITLNAERKLYVLNTGDGCSCLGFDVLKDRTADFAKKLKRKDLEPIDQDYGTLKGYEKYSAAVEAWRQSTMSNHTYFEPNTASKVANILEHYRKERKPIRLFLGNTETGQDWYEENDVVGYVGRSCGTKKVPLLIDPGENGGTAILCSSIVKLMDVQGNDVLWTHPKYKNSMAIRPLQDTAHPQYCFEAFDGDVKRARFRSASDATEYWSFITGVNAATHEQLRKFLAADH